MAFMQGFRRWLHDRMPRTLFGRTLLIIVVPVLLLQITVTIVFFDRHWTKMADRLAASVAGEIAAAANQMEMAQGDSDQLDNIRQLLVANLDIVMDVMPDSDAFMDAPSTRGYGVRPTLARAMQDKVRRPFTITMYPEFKRVRVQVRLEGQAVVQFTIPERRLFSSSSYIFILWMIALSILFFAISILFMRNQIRPIRRLAVFAERLGKGRDVPSLKTSGAREVRQAAEAFSRMQNRIQRQIHQRTAMLAGVSHDLRTPITRLRLQVEMLGDGPDHQAMRADLDDMERMIEGYLAFARGEGDEETQLCDMNALCARVAENSMRQGHAVEFKGLDTPVMMYVRVQAFERAITNIVNNGCAYAENVWMAVYWTAENDRILIVIDDNGPGIPAEQMEDVFRPFFRLDPSRNPKSGGVGLGLSIAQDIATAHGGEITLEDSPMGGLRVIIAIPV